MLNKVIFFEVTVDYRSNQMTQLLGAYLSDEY